MRNLYPKPLAAVLGALSLSVLTAPALHAESASSATSSELPVEWQLEDLYEDTESWESAYSELAGRIEGLGEFENSLTQSPQALARALDSISAVDRDLSRLMVYARLNADEDLRESGPQERVSRTQQLAADFGSTIGYVRPLLAQMARDTLLEWADHEALSVHQRFLEEVARQAPHTLSIETESALAALSPVLSTSNTYSLLANADVDWPTLTVEGEEVLLDQSGYSRMRQSQDREVRREVFDTFWPVWHQYESTFGSLLGNQVRRQVTSARLRDYDSALEAALSGNDIPVAVYRQLIETTNEHLPSLHRYLALRERMLGLDQLHYYDIYPPLVESDHTFDIEQARELTIETARPLGEEYIALLEDATAAPWTSLYPSRGKRSGAYMMGAAYDVHPYVLMNYNGYYGDVSTYAHEWGHGVHSLLANANQPYETADYSIFTAEVASTLNEQLLIRHMIDSAEDDQEKLFYIGQMLESLRGTFFRQTQFAEFELAIHEAVENGEALSGERLTRMYGDILKKYYGVDEGITEIDPDYFIEWAYIPHFYYNFYVYQYATSLAAAESFAQRLLSGDEGMPRTYLEVLEAGGSDSGYRLLANAGVDLATAEPYEQLMDYMNELMDQAEEILDRQ